MLYQPGRASYPEDEFPLQALTGTIIASAYSVFQALAMGFSSRYTVARLSSSYATAA